jgi:hypothetical protein
MNRVLVIALSALVLAGCGYNYYSCLGEAPLPGSSVTVDCGNNRPHYTEYPTPDEPFGNTGGNPQAAPQTAQ